MDRSERKAWLLTFAILGAYMAGSRLVLLLPFPLYSWQAEAPRTVLRCAAAAAYWLVFRGELRPLIRPGAELRDTGRPVGLLLFLAVPLLVSDLRHGPGTIAVNIAGSIAAGALEEIAFRGMIQRLLCRHLHPAVAILATTAGFVAFHVGVVPPVWYAYAQIVPASLLLGILFAGTGNLALVAGVHALYDILAEFGPVLSVPVSVEVAFALLCAAALLTLGWGWRTLRGGPPQD